MSTLTRTRGDEKARALADQLTAQAAVHEQAAEGCEDPFERAAHLGVAQDLRQRAEQALSTTEARQRADDDARRQAADRQAALDQAQADRHAYEQAAAEYARSERDALDTLRRAATALCGAADSLLAARATAEESAARVGIPAPADLVEAHLRALLDAQESPERCGLYHAARQSVAATASRLGAVAALQAEAARRRT